MAHEVLKILVASRGTRSNHRCQLNDAQLLEASDLRSIHRCQPTDVRFLQAFEGASIAANLITAGLGPDVGKKETTS